jgi:hypothetical protein
VNTKNKFKRRKPVKKLVLFIIFLMVINLVYAKKIGILTDVVNPYSISASKGRLYVVDGPVIFIYSLKDLKLEKKFGKKGEGPEEFRINPQINMGSVMLDVYDEFLLVNSLGKISYYSRDGEYKKEIRSTSVWGAFKPLGKKFAGYGVTVKDELRYVETKLYDSDLQKGEGFCLNQVFINIGREVNPFLIHGPAFYTWDNKLYTEKEKDAVEVYDQDGKKIKTLDINQGYKKVAISEKDKKKYLDYFKTEPAFKPIYEEIKKVMKYPDHFPGIKLFYSADKKLYIFRWATQNNKQEIGIFDLNGKLLKNVQVPFYEKDAIFPYAFAIAENILYQLVEDENDEGKWNLFATELK